MIKNYIKSALRNLTRYRAFSAINIFGLALGMACTIVIMLWVQYELEYDSFHENFSQIHRVVSEYDGIRVPTTPGPMAAFLENEIPEIVKATRFKNDNTVVRYGEKSIKIKGTNVEPSYLDIFTFPTISGDPQKALDDPSSIVLTKSAAEKLFGGSDPIGKVVKLSNKWDATVGAVIEDPPKYSSTPHQFEYLSPFKIYYYWREPDNWDRNSDYQTWVMISEKSNVDIVNAKIDELIKRHNDDPKLRFFIQPMSEIHLRADTHRWDGPHGDIRYVIIFSILAIIILGIACINYMNLSTARSITRAKEIGIRKVIGASKKQLVRQYLSESFIFSLFSIPLAIILVELFLPTFNVITENTYQLMYSDLNLILGLVILFLITGLFSGLYPAVVLSTVKLDKLLKSNYDLSTDKNGSVSFREILVVIQFTISIIVICSTFVIHDQLKFIKSENLGFDKENLIYIPIGSNYPDENYAIAKKEILNLPGVISIGGSNQIPIDTDFITGVRWIQNDQKESASMPVFMIDKDFISTYKIQLNYGKLFEIENSADPKRQFVINQTAADKLGFENIPGTNFEAYDREGEIIGVVKDFHFENFHEKIEPLVFMYNSVCGFLNIRLLPGNQMNTINKIKKIVGEFYPGHPFEFHYLDQQIENLYKTEFRMGILFNYFSLLAIAISCLGLLGLISFMVERKTKEVGIRKVLGASYLNIIGLLAKEYTRLIIIANIIAIPVAYYLLNNWLQNFDYKTEMNIGFFFASGIIALTIAIIIIGLKGLRAAMANPIDSLKDE